MEIMKKDTKIIVSKSFVEMLKEQYEYIKDDSPKNADTFKNGISPLIDKISQNPEAYPPVKQLPTKRNLYRFALYKRNWKVVFKNLKSTLIFLGFFHKKQNPEKIKTLKTTKYQ
jgi:plasmid stabilization system protein ParE